MVGLGDLWLPILVSAVLVFIVSAIIHMVLKYHNTDYSRLPNEDAVRAAIRAGKPAPAQYVIPYCSEMKDMEKPEMKQKYTEGPVAVITVLPHRHSEHGQEPGPVVRVHLLWSLSSSPTWRSHSLARERPTSRCSARSGRSGSWPMALGQVPNSIWWGKPWKKTVKNMLDGFVYGAGDGGDVRVAVAEVSG